MKTKYPILPQRLRRVPRQFSWIDQRLVRDGHIARCGPAALALYLLLVTVADAQGLSYYSDAKAAQLLSLSSAELVQARRQLILGGLVAYRNPLYQVLSLEPEQAQPPVMERTGELLSMSAVMRRMFEAGQARPSASPEAKDKEDKAEGRG